jgi:hypothetical protein
MRALRRLRWRLSVSALAARWPWLRRALGYLSGRACRRCYREIGSRLAMDFWVPDDVWDAVEGGRVPLCLPCFDSAALGEWRDGGIGPEVVGRYVDGLVVLGAGLWALEPWADLAIRSRAERDRAERMWEWIEPRNALGGRRHL